MRVSRTGQRLNNRAGQSLAEKKREVIKQLPPLTEILRGTFIKCYLQCIRPNCKCHKAKIYRHGPYYRVSYGKGKQVHHIYVPLKMKKMVQKWTINYNKLWQVIEDISVLNIKIIREESSK